MIDRKMTVELLDAATEYPVVALFGPRQSGKTTLVRHAFPHLPYRSIEDPDIRMAAEQDPRGFLATLPHGGIIDEIQRLPPLLSYIQGIVDQQDLPGMFVITGSHQPELHQAVSQSLAGRVAVLTLLPCSIEELLTLQKGIDPFKLIASGMFPRLQAHALNPVRFFNSYMQTYIERDVRTLIRLNDLSCFQRFLTLLAGRVGQIINYANISNDIGVSSTTIKNWISVLKASYVVFELPPFYANIRKRLVKSPKLYFIDPGLAAYLLGISDADQAARDPLRGGLYENLMILEVMKSKLNAGLSPELFFYRDSHGNEVDLIVCYKQRYIPIEIKSAATFTPQFIKGIAQFHHAIGDKCAKGIVLYNGQEQHCFHGINVLNPLLHSGWKDEFTPA